MNPFQVQTTPLHFGGYPNIGRTTVPSFIEIVRSAEISAGRAIVNGSFFFMTY